MANPPKIAVFTGTRAEYGLLQRLMKAIRDTPDLQLQLIVSGAHLSPEFGETWREIEQDGFTPDARVEMLLSSDTPSGTAKSMGLGCIGFADALDRLKPDCLVLLGDRFEALAIAQVAMVMRVPVAHLHGGEITEGAFDDSIRHAITKLSHYHFVSCEQYRKRVMQLGEQPDCVLNVGAPGIENILHQPLMPLAELSSTLPLSLTKPYFLVTYHSVTAGNEDPEQAFKALLEALDYFPGYQLLFTLPNADHGGRRLIQQIKRYTESQPQRAQYVASLGMQRYLSAVKHSSAVIGNSSSGILEVPSLQVPSINIGIRQLGRLAAESVIHCTTDCQAIIAAIQRAESDEFKQQIYNITNPYEQKHTSKLILSFLKKLPPYAAKRFYDLPQQRES